MPASVAAELTKDEVDPLQRLRAQLADMRSELVTQLSREVPGGDLALLNSVTGAGVEAEIAARD